MTRNRTGWGRVRALALTLAAGAALRGLAACDGQGEPTHPEPTPGPGGLSVLFRAPVAGAFDTFVPTSDGQRLYADVQLRIQAFGLNDGALLWSYARPQGGPSALVVRAGRLFFAGDTAVALEAATGHELWRRPLAAFAGFCESDGDDDDDAFYTGTLQHRVMAFRAADGAVLWERDLGPDWPYKGTVRGITVSGDTVYAVVEHDTGVNGHVGTGDVFALDRRTGETLWSWRNGDGTRLDIFQSAARVAGPLLLLTANWDNEYVALNRFTREVVWRVAAGQEYFGMEEAPEVSGGKAFFASQDHHAVALELATGRQLWRTPVGSGASWVAVCGTRLLVKEYGLSVLDAETGETLGRGYDSSTGEVLHTDFVVVGSRAYVFGDDELYAFECPR